MKTIIICLFIFVGVIVLQVFFSKRENKWAGLILPLITFLVALLYTLMMPAAEEWGTAGFYIEMITMWLFANIPTIVLLAIYFGCRGKQRRNKQLDKMNIQDLD